MINRQVAPVLEPQVSCLLQEFRVARCRLVLLSPTLPGLQPVCRSSAVAQYCPKQHLLIFSVIGVNQGEKKRIATPAPMRCRGVPSSRTAFHYAIIIVTGSRRFSIVDDAQWG